MGARGWRKWKRVILIYLLNNNNHWYFKKGIKGVSWLLTSNEIALSILQTSLWVWVIVVWRTESTHSALVENWRICVQYFHIQLVSTSLDADLGKSLQFRFRTPFFLWTYVIRTSSSSWCRYRLFAFSIFDKRSLLCSIANKLLA